MGIPSQQMLAEVAKVSLRTIGNLERGIDVSYTTLGRVEAALGWAPGSAAEILNGGEPRPAAPSSAARADRRGIDAANPRRQKIIDATPELLLDIHGFVEEVLGREVADKWMTGAMRVREAGLTDKRAGHVVGAGS